jgi:phage terminase large subunit-like protein
MTLSVAQIQKMGREIALYQPLGDTQCDFHNCTAQQKWLFGGNQSSKTYTSMMDLALLLLDFHPAHSRPRGVHWACIESWEQVRDILWEDNLKQFIPAHAISNVDYGTNKVPKRVFLKNGHKLEFKAFNQGRELFQGRGIDSIHCDEQCLHDFTGILEECQARILRKDGFMSWSMTPIIPQSELEERIEDLPDTDEVYKINLNDNRISRGGYIPDARIDAMIDQWPEETQATRIAGEFASFFGSVFKTYKRQDHVIDPFKIPSDWRRYRTFDFGFTNPFVCLWVAQDNDDNWYVYREYYQAQTGISDHIRALKIYSKGERYVKNVADPENAEDRAEMKKAGIVTIPARKEIARGIETVQSKFKIKANKKPSLFIFRTCKNTAREISAYHYPKGTSKSNPKDIPVQKDDHTIDALRYLLHTLCGKFKRGKVCAA